MFYIKYWEKLIVDLILATACLTGLPAGQIVVQAQTQIKKTLLRIGFPFLFQ